MYVRAYVRMYVRTYVAALKECFDAQDDKHRMERRESVKEALRAVPGWSSRLAALGPTYIRTYVRTYVRAYVRTYIRTYVLTSVRIK